MERLRVLHIVSWYSPNGDKEMFAGVFHNEFARALQSRCDTAIWFPFDKKIEDGVNKESEWGVLTFRSNVTSNKVLLLRKAKADFSCIIKEFNPDIIHAHVARMAGFIAAYIGKKFNIPVVITEHEPVEMMKRDKLRFRMVQSYAYKNSSKNICVSEDLSNKLRKLYKRESFITIHNGVDDPVKYLEAESVVYRIDDGINSVIVAGFYNREVKGFQYLLPAIKMVNESRDKKVYLHICGDGAFLEYYENLAEEIGVFQYCRFYGHCSRKKVFNIINQMNFGISASLFESAGVSIEEMLLLGKPMVVTESGGGNSLVSEENAIVVKKGSIESLSQGIVKMADAYSNYDSDSIRLNALKMYEMSYIVDKYIDVYRTISQKGII